MRNVLFALVCMVPAGAQERPDLNTVHQIKTEAFDNSKVMETLSYLTDMYGPRLTASPEFKQAADWAVKRLTGYGVEDVRLEKWGPFGRSWSEEHSSLEMLEPRYARLTATPLAWSGSTNGPVTADAIYAPITAGRRFNIKDSAERLDKFILQWKGKLKGKIVLISESKAVAPSTKPSFVRYTDQELSEMSVAPAPTAKVPFDPANLQVPEDEEQALQYIRSLPESLMDKLFDQRKKLTQKRNQFLLDEGIAGVLTSDERAHGGLVFAEAAGSHEAKDTLAPPVFVVTKEHYNRIKRILEMKESVKLRLDLQAKTSNTAMDGYNIVGEIPGGKKKDEIVMIGAHFDSWHSGTGATDNGAGSAVMIEVMRILKALNLKMDRTVRIGLWSGEEQGLYGSKAYVKEHFADPDTMKVTEAHGKLDGYFNLDNGSGKIRGVYLQGNDAMRPLFEQWLGPFRDEGATSISIRNTGGTDHLSFDEVGLPGFQFIQDPLAYMNVTHHSDMDVYDQAQPGDLMQAAAVIASVVYDAANRAEMLPRKPLPKAQGVSAK